MSDTVDNVMDVVNESEPADGVKSVLIPGDPERESQRRLLEEGIEVDDNSWEDFLTAGGKAGLTLEDLDLLTSG